MLTFQDGIGLEDLLLDPRVLARDGGQVLEDELGRLGLAGPRLPRDDDALVLPGPPHQRVAVVSDGEDVRGKLANLLLLVQLDLLRCVDRQNLQTRHRYIIQTYCTILRKNVSKRHENIVLKI